MQLPLFSRAVRRGVALVALSTSAPCLAQSSPVPAARSAPVIAPADVIAFAKLSLSVSQVRDSIQ